MRRRRLVVRDGTEIRAFHNFLEQELYVDGRPHAFVWPNGPLSEAIVDRRFASSYLVLIRHSLGLNPRHLFLGGPDNIQRLLLRLGWKEVGSVPSFLLMLRLSELLREMPTFRRTRTRRWIAGALSKSGLGALHGFWRPIRSHGRRTDGLVVEECDAFGEWADAVWRRAVGRYRAVTRRDAATLNRLYKPGDRRFRRLRMRRGGEDVGWLLFTSRLRRPPDIDLGLGNASAAAIVDALADPREAPAVLRAGVRTIAAEGHAAVFGHWSHLEWQRACRLLGFRQWSRTKLLASPDAARELFPDPSSLASTHFTDGDNDGPYYVAPEVEADPTGRGGGHDAGSS